MSCTICGRADKAGCVYCDDDLLRSLRNPSSMNSHSGIIIGPGQVYVETEWQDADGAMLTDDDQVVPMAHIGETRGSQPDADSAA